MIRLGSATRAGSPRSTSRPGRGAETQGPGPWGILDRHLHPLGYETYVVLTGQMSIRVACEPGDCADCTEHTLGAGDSIVVMPGVWHEVQRGSEFLAQVVAVDCVGKDPTDPADPRNKVVL